MGWQVQQWQPPYCHANLLAEWMRLDSKTEPELVLCAEAASRAIDKATGRQFGRVAEPEARFYTAEWFKDRWVVTIDDLMITTGLVIEVDNDQDGTPEAEISDYTLTPANAVAKGFPWTAVEILPRSPVKPNGLRHGVKITAVWGWDSIPRAIETAAMIQAARLYERRDNPAGPLIRKEVDDVRYGWGNASTPELDADVAASIAPFRRYWAAV